MNSVSDETSFHGIPRPSLYNLSRGTLGIATSLVDVSVSGQENIPDDPCIVASTHWGFGDVAVLCRAVSNKPKKPGLDLQFVAKEELFKGALGWWLKNCGVIPINRKNPSSDSIHEMIQAENSLVIFPGGKLDNFPEVSEPKVGLSIIAALSGKLILPVGIRGTEKHRLNPIPIKAHAHIGKPFTAESLQKNYDPSLDLSIRGLIRLKRSNKHLEETSHITRESLESAFQIASEFYEAK